MYNAKVIDVKLEKINQAAFHSLVKSISIYEAISCINPCTFPTRQAIFSASIKLLIGLLKGNLSFTFRLDSNEMCEQASVCAMTKSLFLVL